MNVDATAPWQSQDQVRQNLAKRGHYDRRWRQGLQSLEHVRLSQALWLQDWQTLCQCQSLDRRDRGPATSTGLPVWLGHHCGNLILADERAQDQLAKVRSPHEHEAIHLQSQCTSQVPYAITRLSRSW